MSYKITDQCIACENCSSYCPTGAISKNEKEKFSINTDLCNDCVGSYGVAQCLAGCPTFDGCIPSISNMIKSTKKTKNKYWDNWFATYNGLTSKFKAKKETQYWQDWFNFYSQKLELLLHT